MNPYQKRTLDNQIAAIMRGLRVGASKGALTIRDRATIRARI